VCYLIVAVDRPRVIYYCGTAAPHARRGTGLSLWSHSSHGPAATLHTHRTERAGSYDLTENLTEEQPPVEDAAAASAVAGVSPPPDYWLRVQPFASVPPANYPFDLTKEIVSYADFYDP